jgi:ABC-type multidrug transport system ATPase subunit
MSTANIIQVENLKKSYKSLTAIRDINFNVSKGELFGLIGPDGAGKTTIFRILTTLLIQDEGSATVEGYDVVKDYRKIRSLMGYMPGRFSLYLDMTVRENLEFFATIFGTTIEENYHLIKDIYQQIEPFKDRLAGNLSGGMKQKLALSCALIHKPTVLILDEPTTGVDAVSRKEFWDMLIKLKQQGITILVSTPYMDEAELCDRVGLIQNGRMLTINKPDQIVRNFPKKLWAATSASIYQLLQDLREHENLYSVYPFGSKVHFTKDEQLTETSEIKAFLIKRGHESVDIEEVTPTIEDCFIDLMTIKHG